MKGFGFYKFKIIFATRHVVHYDVDGARTHRVFDHEYILDGEIGQADARKFQLKVTVPNSI